jgi:hypothetical protein
MCCLPGSVPITPLHIHRTAMAVFLYFLDAHYLPSRDWSQSELPDCPKSGKKKNARSCDVYPQLSDGVFATRKRRRAFAGVKVLKGVTLGLSEIGTHGPAGVGLFVLDLGLAVLTHRPRVLPVPHD